MQQSAQLETAVAERERGGRGTATVERLQHAGDGGHEVDPTGRQRIVAAPLDKLYKQGRVTSREFQAGDKYRGLHYVANLDPAAPTVDWSRVGSSFGSRQPTMFNAQHIANARHQVRKIEEAIPRQSLVSAVLYIGLVREESLEAIGELYGSNDEREAVIAGRTGLRTALASLADYFDA